MIHIGHLACGHLKDFLPLCRKLDQALQRELKMLGNIAVARVGGVKLCSTPIYVQSIFL